MNRLLLAFLISLVWLAHSIADTDGRPTTDIEIYDYPFVGVIDAAFELRSMDIRSAKVGGEPFFPWIRLNLVGEAEVDWAHFKTNNRGPHAFVADGTKVVFSGYLADFGEPPFWRRLSGYDVRRKPGKDQTLTRAALERLATELDLYSQDATNTQKMAIYSVGASFEFSYNTIEKATRIASPAGAFAIAFDLTKRGIEERDQYSIHSSGQDAVFVFADVLATVSFNRPARDKLIMHSMFTEGFTEQHLDKLITLFATP